MSVRGPWPLWETVASCVPTSQSVAPTYRDLGKVEGGNLEEVGNRNHLPQDSGLVEEDNRVMVVVGGCDVMEIVDG